MNKIPYKAITILTTGISLSLLTFSLFVHGFNNEQVKKDQEQK